MGGLLAPDEEGSFSDTPATALHRQSVLGEQADTTASLTTAARTCQKLCLLPSFT